MSQSIGPDECGGHVTLEFHDVRSNLSLSLSFEVNQHTRD